MTSTDPGLRRLALQTLLAAFPGTRPPEWTLQLLADGLAGYTLFGSNVSTLKQLAELTTQLAAVRTDALIAIDEEGGDVTRLAHAIGSPYPGNAALGRVDDPELTHTIYQAIGAELVAVGVNLDLAPTADVNSADNNPIIGTRSFGADSDLVARHTAAAVTGLRQAGVGACAKHFPGHGSTVMDSHLTLPTVDATSQLLHTRDLPPFAAAITAGVPAIMTAHIRVPALTGDAPATFSRSVLVELLREEYGFGGALVTDALEMAGAADAAGGVPNAAVRALVAGADLLCIGSQVDAALVEQVAAAIVAAVQHGELPLTRLEEAAERSAALATTVTTTAGSATAAAPAVPMHIGELAVRIARDAILVEGTLPPLADALVVQLEAPSTIAAGRVPWGLVNHLAGAESVDPAGINATSLRQQADQRPVVVVGRRMHQDPAARTLVEALSTIHPTVVVEMGWPSSWRPPKAQAFLVTYGASRANGEALIAALGLPRANLD